MKAKFIFSGILSGVLVFSACKKPSEELVANIPPETHVFVEGRTDTVPALQVIHWYGNDPDGEVVGYYYHWDNDTPAFTTATSDTFILSVPDTDSIGVHTFYVWAVDNEGAEDPTPATLTIPAKNSPPTIRFQHNTLPPDTTLPFITYYVEMHDIDGDESVIGFYYWTDYDTVWKFRSVDTPHITFEHVPEGMHYFYFAAVDKSHAVSEPIMDSAYIIPAVGHILVIDDCLDGNADNTYQNFLDTYYAGQYTRWNVKDFLPYSPYDIDGIVNELGFDIIFWYTDRQANSFLSLNKAFERFLNEGHKAIVISPSIMNTLYNPQDTLSSWQIARHYFGVDRVSKFDTMMLSDGFIKTNTQDTLENLLPAFNIDKLIPSTDSMDAECIFAAYKQGETGTLFCGGVRFPSNAPQVYFMSFEMNKFNKRGNLQDILHQIFQEIGER